MDVVVTGAAGFIGSNLTDLLLSTGHDVLAIDDLLRQREIEFGKGDGLHRRAERLKRGLDLQLGGRAQLETLDVIRGVDRMHSIRHVAEAVFPISQ